MKIVQYSVDPKEWSLVITCDWCNSKIQVEANDIHHEGESGDYKDAGWDRYTCECGACGEEIELNEKKLPNLIQSHAQNRKKKKK